MWDDGSGPDRLHHLEELEDELQVMCNCPDRVPAPMGCALRTGLPVHVAKLVEPAHHTEQVREFAGGVLSRLSAALCLVRE
jgi:hypothetical protein